MKYEKKLYIFLFSSKTKFVLKSENHLYLYKIKRIRKHLTNDLARALIQATITARLDYYNSLLYECSDGEIKMLQRLQNMAARLECNSTCFCRVTPLMFKLCTLATSQTKN